MRLIILAIGKIRPAAPEAALVARYAARIRQVGRGQGFSDMEIREIALHAGGAEGVARAMLAAIPEKALCVALDAGGKAFSSPAFARALARWRAAGAGDLVFLIGGADGLAQTVRGRAAHSLSLGLMAWPHKLARVMLCEQIYRALTILGNHPYHRA